MAVFAILSAGSLYMSLGGIACIGLLNAEGVEVQRDKEGAVHTCSSLPLHYMRLTYFSGEQHQARRGTQQNHRLTEVPW